MLREIGGDIWLGACEKEIGSIRERVVRLATIFRIIKASINRHRSADPISVDFHSYVDWESLEVAWPKLDTLLGTDAADEMRNHCHIACQAEATAVLSRCDGTHAIELLADATSFYRPRGIASRRQIDADTLLSMFRSAFHPADLEQDEMFWKMKKWERVNPRYKLLQVWRELDPLGTVWDQRYWEKDLPALLSTLGAGAIMAVFKMDLDNFKSVNEACGHTTGDDAIRLYCSIAKEVLGGVGEVYRRGGDEVLALAPGVTEGIARELAEKIRSQIESTFRDWGSTKGLSPTPTASIGLTVVSRDTPVAYVLERVDAAQRAAKQGEKNRVVVFTGPQVRLTGVGD